MANTPPVANPDSNSILEDATPNFVTSNVITNDSDADSNALVVTNVGTFTGQYGTFVVNLDGSYRYTLDNSNPTVAALNNGQHIADTRTYIITDGNGGTSSSTLTITINGASDNRLPVSNSDTNTIREDGAPNLVMGNVLTNDSDPDGNALTVTNTGNFVRQYGTLVIQADGSYSYTLDNSNPAVNALGNGQQLVETFNYAITDGHGGTSSSTLSITITGTTENSAPSGRADVNSITEGAATKPVAGNVLANDSDPDGNSLLVANAGTITLQYGSLLILADGSYSYTLDNSDPTVAALTFGQTLTDSFTYTLSDGYGGTASASLSITINGADDNLAPVNTTPSMQAVFRNNALIFSAAGDYQLAVADSDAGSEAVQVTLSASAGLMTLSQTTGLTFTQGDGTSDAAITFSGMIADINAALEGMQYLSSRKGSATISMTTNDLGHSGSGTALADTDAIAIKVRSNVTTGSNGSDNLKGTSDNDEVLGRGGQDTLSGRGGDDILDGGKGLDLLRGDAGADTLTGGRGADVFWYGKVRDSTLTSMDAITDFDPSGGDRIDLSAIDANEIRQGNQAFTFIGTGDFSGEAGELRFERGGGGTHIYGDTDGDGVADLAILLSSDVTLRAGDFEF